MSIQTALASHLKNEPVVAEKVGAHVYIGVAPTNATLPRLTIHRIGDAHVHHMTAASGMADVTIQVDCWADDPIEADEVAETVRESLDGLHHMNIGLAPNTIYVRGARLDGTVDDFESPSDGATPRLFVVHQTWSIWHTESIPTFV